MASPDAIRKALMALLGAKKANKGDISRVGSGETLNQARQQARDVQGVDPLANKIPGENIPTAPQQSLTQGLGQPDPLLRARVTGRNPSRLPGRGQIDDPIENLAIQEEAATDITNLAPYGDDVGDFIGAADQVRNPGAVVSTRQIAQEFEQLVGRPPTPEELARPQDMQRVIEVLKFGRDEIPF